MVVPLTMHPLCELYAVPEIRAFLDTIAYAEGTDGKDGYKMLYGGGKVTSCEKHPHEKVCNLSQGKKLCSTAAGRYQFLYDTWKDIAEKNNINSFFPFDQDLAAIALLKQIHVIEDLKEKHIISAIKKSSAIWASFPGSPYGQPTKTVEDLVQVWQKRLRYYNTKLYKSKAVI